MITLKNMRGVPSTCELRKDVNISMWFLFLLMWNSPDDVSMEKSWIFSLFSIWIVLRWQVWKKVDAIKWYQIQGLYTEDMIVQIKFGNAYVSICNYMHAQRRSLHITSKDIFGSAIITLPFGFFMQVIVPVRAENQFTGSSSSSGYQSETGNWCKIGYTNSPLIRKITLAWMKNLIKRE